MLKNTVFSVNKKRENRLKSITETSITRNLHAFLIHYSIETFFTLLALFEKWSISKILHFHGEGDTLESQFDYCRLSADTSGSVECQHNGKLRQEPSISLFVKYYTWNASLSVLLEGLYSLLPACFRYPDYQTSIQMYRRVNNNF